VAVAALSLFCAIGVLGEVTTPSTQDVSRDVWQLTLQLTGGIAGNDRQLELASTGELKVTDRRRGTHAITQASASELTQIASMVADLKSADPVRRSTCRDCIQYDLTIRLSGRPLVFSLNDVSVVGTPVEPLIKVLADALNRELSRQRKPQVER